MDDVNGCAPAASVFATPGAMMPNVTLFTGEGLRVLVVYLQRLR